jgi:4-aminobutyrate aminotransferase
MNHDGERAAEGDTNTSPKRATWHAGLDDATKALLEEDARWFLHQSLSTPCLDVLDSAIGSELTDIAGRSFLDFHGNSVHQIGHGHPRVIAAIKAQLDALSFSPRRYTNRPAIALAERLANLAPGNLDKVLLAPSGAVAVAMALKLARLATGRHKTLSMWDSFHGATLDTISVGGESTFRRGVGPLLPGTEHLPPLDLAARFFGDDGHAFDRLADYMDYVLGLEGDVAAVITEPMRWTTVMVPPLDFWRQVKAICERHGTLLIVDEIPSCLGRTGAMFACEHFGVTPDILVIGKGLGGGIMPMAAMIARGDLDIAPQASLGHFTHEKSPVGAAAALATLDVIAEEGLVERARTLGAAHLDRLRDLVARHDFLTEARGIGLVFGIAVGGDNAERRADAILYGALERGLSFKVGGGNVLTLCPPLTATTDELDRALSILDQACADTEPA